MSKMGQYVFDLMTVEEAEFYGHSNRERCTNAQADKDTRVATGHDGDRGLIRGAHQCGGADRGSRPTAKDFPLATGSTAKEILRRS
jgi:hypothetical protein